MFANFVNKIVEDSDGLGIVTSTQVSARRHAVDCDATRSRSLSANGQ